ncbi:MAG: flagellar hook-length control protein FliK [Steroidobacteraceae bacterium]
MNIASSTPPDPTANATAASSAAPGAATEPTSGSGFLALIGALLQGTVLPGTVIVGTTGAAAGETGTPELALASGLPLLEGAPPDDEAGETEDPEDVLATLGLSPWVPPLAPPPPAPQEVVAASGDTAPAAAALALPIKSQTPPNAQRTAAPATPDAMTTVAQHAAGKPPEGDAAVFDAVASEAIAALTGSDDAGSRDSGSPSSPSQLNTWAAAANRIAGGADATVRSSAVPPEATMRETVGTPRWKDELGTHLTLMAVKGQQSGSLRLSPEHLGPLEIQITVADDKTTSVQFGAQQAETRVALQEAMPRLRELFQAAGLQLGDAGVSQQAAKQSQSQTPTPDRSGSFGPDGAGDGEPTRLAGRVSSVTHSGLLDTYA